MIARLKKRLIRSMQVGSWALALGNPGGRHAVWAQGAPPPDEQAAGVRVSGRFVTPDNRPIAGAKVFWIDQADQDHSQRRFTASTDAQGRFEFPLAAPPSKPNGSIQFFSVFFLARSPKGDMGLQHLPTYLRTGMPLTIVSVPLTTLRVPCLDPSGKPVPDLSLRVKSLGPFELPAELRVGWEQRSDAQGECVFSGLPQVTIRLAMRGEKFALLNTDTTIPLDTKAFQRSAPLLVQRGGAVSGRVTDSQDGRPVAGVRVEAHIVRPGFQFGGAITDAQGRYCIRGLQPGTYNIVLCLTGAQAARATALALQNVTVQAESTVDNQDLTLIPGSLVSGKVIDGGKPAPDRTVYLFGPAQPASGSAGQTAITGPDGVYRAHVPAGAHYIYPITPFSIADELAGAHSSSGDARVTVPEHGVLTQDFTRTYGFAFPIYVKVVGPDDKPVPYATLTVSHTISTIEGPEWGMGGEGMTDADGAYVLRASLWGTAYLHAYSGSLGTDSVTKAQTSDHVTLHLKPNVLFTLGGQAVDARNRPIAGATVTVHGAADSDMKPETYRRISTTYSLARRTTLTDRQGRFTLRISIRTGATG